MEYGDLLWLRYDLRRNGVSSYGSFGICRAERHLKRKTTGCMTPMGAQIQNWFLVCELLPSQRLRGCP